MIYLDNAATTYPKPEKVYQALDAANRNLAFNAGRGHYEPANIAFNIIEKTRKFLCEKACANHLSFTPSATHALNQIIAGIEFNETDIVYCSPYDHNAIARTLYAYSKKIGFVVKLIPVNKDNSIDLKKLEFNCIKDKPKAIFCTHVSNVTGYILPIKEIGEIAYHNSSLFVVDGAQAFGLIPVNLKEMHVDYYVFAGHKTLYGPFGIAGYFTNRNDLNLSFFGGTGSDSLNLDMPSLGALRYEPSSPNVVAIAGLYESAKWVFENDIYSHEKKLLKYAVTQLEQIDGITIYSSNSNSTGILSFNLEGYKSEELSNILFTDFDICTRGGYHCCPFIHDLIDTKQFLGTVRVSFGYFTISKEIDHLVNALNLVIEEE